VEAGEVSGDFEVCSPRQWNFRRSGIPAVRAKVATEEVYNSPSACRCPNSSRRSPRAAVRERR
jgi:hypothetical protein